MRLKSFTAPPDLKKLEEAVEKLRKEKEEAIRCQEFEKAASIRDKEHNIKDKLELEKSNWHKKTETKTDTVEEDEIADIIGLWTGIPVKKLAESESERLKNMEGILHKRVIGQVEAVKSISKAIRRGRVGLKDPKRPVGSFIFLGPTW